MTFQWPLMLLSLLLLPLLAGLYLLAQRRRRAYAVRFTNLALLKQVAGPGPGLRRHIPPALYLLGAAALLLGLARPTAVMAVPREQASVVLAIDISSSMAAEDLNPTRMAAAQMAAHAFVDSLPEDTRIALVSFHIFASVNVPLTRDHEMIRRGIDMLTPGGATAMGDGLYLALDQLAMRSTVETDPENPGPTLVLLLSDGESNRGIDPFTAAERARGDGVPVYTVGIGQRGQTAYVKDTPVGLDEKTLLAMAEMTGGSYFYAAETSQLTEIYTNLGSQFGWEEEQTEVTALVAGVGAVFIVAAGILGLLWFQQFP
jgi:Ca-activated chloride channel homolog